MIHQKLGRFALTTLSVAVTAMVSATAAQAQTANDADKDKAAAQKKAAPGDTTAQRANASTTSNTTNANATKATINSLEKVTVEGRQQLGGGLMSVQVAPKAVSTITRAAIEEAAPSATYAQLIDTIPGVVAITDDPSGLFDANYQIRGFTNDQIGVTVNGAPVNDSGNYRVYPTEYGDTENMNDITVLHGYPDVDQAVAGAAGGSIAWSTIDPSHKFSVDTTLSGGSRNYQREFMRVQTGDIGPVRSWLSYSHNSTDVWRGKGNAQVWKVDGKSVWTIDSDNSISASLQYNHLIRTGGYQFITQAASVADYYANYDTAYTATNTAYYKLHVNPFKDYMLSLDGEFTLTPSLHLTVIPYFQYGSGGGGSGYTFTENTTPGNVGRFSYVNFDLDGDGAVTNGKKVMTYSYSGSQTWRPGVLAKLIQDFGDTDTLTYGVWFDRPRQEQSQNYSKVDADGNPLDIWGGSNLISYVDGGGPQYNYLNYTTTTLKRAFISNEWTPNSQWTVTLAGAYTSVERAGYGYQHYGAHAAAASLAYTNQFGGSSSHTWNKFTPSAGVKFQYDKANQFFLGYGRSFRAPVNGVVTQSDAVLAFYEQNPDEVAFSGYTPAQLRAALEKLAVNQPETADTVDMGWRYYHGAFSGSVDIYASDLKNKQVNGYDSASNQTVYLAVPKLRQRGINAEGAYKVSRSLSLYASYAHTKSTIMDDTFALGDGTYPTAGKSFVDIPKNTFALGVNYRNGPFFMSVNAKYRSEFWADWVNTEKAPGYATVNLNTGWNFGDVASWAHKVKLKLNVTNLTNKKAVTFASATNFLSNNPSGAGQLIDSNTGKALYASASTYNLLAPRAVMLSLSASFN
ncbi:TonB-dependent receptor [Roseateles cellulosilyticus]|uniref:TonB-dependent receptor n=1 Tax=Pelomonas cellulosilytica TaxID=2906762 RepID=A0ABS8XMU0_9BURK|nr:TonB-dependent receptor [Pelomonas sp. P8]MCE4554087.1 TonB-dependent receptor [Pelomonas sp. P8]